MSYVIIPALYTLMFLCGCIHGRNEERRRAREARDRRTAKIFADLLAAEQTRPSPVTMRLIGFPSDAAAAEYLANLFGGTSTRPETTNDE